MKPIDIAYLGVGVFIGAGVIFYQVDTPRADRCETYKVSRKVATAYVLKPPPAEVVYQACPQITQKIEEAKVEEPVAELEKPRRHRRHHRVRRYWR